MDPQFRKYLLLILALFALLLGFLSHLYLDEPRRRIVYRPLKDPFEPSGQTWTPPETPETRPDAPPDTSGTVRTLTEAILDIAPEIYYSVRLELESGEYLGQAEESASLNSVFVRIIEIFARSRAWDRLQSVDKVRLLYRTFDMLRKRYPEITRFVRIIFDDNRKNLELKFDDILKTPDLFGAHTPHPELLAGTTRNAPNRLRAQRPDPSPSCSYSASWASAPASRGRYGKKPGNRRTAPPGRPRKPTPPEPRPVLRTTRCPGSSRGRPPPSTSSATATPSNLRTA